LRFVITLLIVLWLGGVLFFPVVAWIAFSNLPDTHTAGIMVRLCLHTLHLEGLASGAVLLILLMLAGQVRAYGRSTAMPVVATLIMLGLTAFSQFSIMPRMERDRLAVGGSVDAAAAGDSHRIDFERLHVLSERVEEGVLAAGLALVCLLARPPLGSRRRSRSER
jgi:hypothetical protein